MLFTDDELASWPGVESPVSPGTVDLLRDIVSSKIYRLLPQADADASTEAKGVALEVVARALRNTNGYQSETVDDYSYRRATGTGSAGIYLTDAERAELIGIKTGGASRVRSVRLISAYDS